MSSNTTYHNANSPYGSGDPYYSASTGYITPAPMKKRTSNWIKIGVPVLVVVIIAAVVGGVLGSRHHNNSSASASGADSAATGAAAASNAASLKNAIGVYPTATDSQYLLPIYPSTVSPLLPVTPSSFYVSRILKFRFRSRVIVDQHSRVHTTYFPSYH